MNCMTYYMSHTFAFTFFCSTVHLAKKQHSVEQISIILIELTGILLSHFKFNTLDSDTHLSVGLWNCSDQPPVSVQNDLHLTSKSTQFSYIANNVVTFQMIVFKEVF